MSSAAQARYRELYGMQRDQRLYAAPWWLDAACGDDGWSVAHIENVQGRWMMPYCHRRIRSMQAAITPPLTQWVDIIGSGLADDAIHQQVLKHIPRVSILDISLAPGIQVAPDRSFRISSQYSYVFPPVANSQEAVSRYNESLRQRIRQAPEQFIIDRTPDIDKLLALYAAVFKQKGIKSPWWIQSVLPRLTKTLVDRGQAEMRFALRNGETIAGSLVAHDDHHAYYLVGGRIPGDSGLSAHAWLLHDAIVAAGTQGRDFDFEGSMVPGVASFFQTFGARPLPFTRIRRFRGMGRLWSVLR